MGIFILFVVAFNVLFVITNLTNDIAYIVQYNNVVIISKLMYSSELGTYLIDKSITSMLIHRNVNDLLVLVLNEIDFEKLFYTIQNSHLILNMVSLMIINRNIIDEDLSTKLFIVIIGTLIGNTLSVYAINGIVVYGLSGGIFALLGYSFYCKRVDNIIWNVLFILLVIDNMLSLIGVIPLLTYGITSDLIAHDTHLYGLLFGMLFGFVITITRRYRERIVIS